jgi:hypothetical protein
MPSPGTELEADMRVLLRLVLLGLVIATTGRVALGELVAQPAG